MSNDQANTAPSSLIAGSVRRSGSFLTGRKTVGIELQIAAGENYSIAAVAENLVRALAAFLPAPAPAGQVNGDAVSRLSPNLRGTENFTAAGPADLIRPGREQLFFATGTVIRPSTDDSALKNGTAGSADVQDGAVWYSLTTQFERSDGKSIWYRLNSQSSPELSRYLPILSPRLFTRFLPVALNQVRLGFDLFGTRHLGSSLLGSGPVVIGRLNISVLPVGVKILIEEQFARGRNGIPLSGRGIPELLQQWLSDSEISLELIPYCTALLRAGK